MGTSTFVRQSVPKFLMIIAGLLLNISVNADSNMPIQPSNSNCEVMGGMVFYDDDGDGCHFPIQEGYVEGVSVYLFSCSQQNPEIQNALASDITDVHGEYVFGGDEEGSANICLNADSTYYVLFELMSNTTNPTLEYFCFTRGDNTNCYNSESRDDVVDWTTGLTDCYNPVGDDDDDDIVAGLMLCDDMIDLALIKEVVTPGPYRSGDIVEFEITIVNQTGATAAEIEIVDHLPSGFSYDPSLNPSWNDATAPIYSHVINTTLAPGDLITVSINLTVEFVSNQLPENYTNIAEIGWAKNSNGDLLRDMDSTPDRNPWNDGDPIDNSLDDKDDEDDHDMAALPLRSRIPAGCTLSCDAACIGQLNLSLGEGCSATVVPSMLMPGLASGCDDISNADYFEIILTDHYGDPIEGNVLGAEHVGQLIQYSIKVINTDIMDPDATCENSCWGNILVESKVIPVLDCTMGVQTISCIELPTFEGPPLSGSGTIGCFASEVEIEILNEEVVAVDECEGDIIRRVIRQYQAVDVQGNRSNICSQELNIVRLDTDFIKFPDNSSQELECDADFLQIPTDTFIVGTVPYYCPPGTGSGTMPMSGSGMMSMTGSGTPIALYPVPESACNIFVDFEDEVILDLPCKKQVLRTWNVRQWHCNEEFNETSVQLVTLVDTQAPVLDCPSDTIHVSTSGSDCTAKVTLPEILAVDSCQLDVSQIDISFPGGFVENQNGGEVNGVPVGLHPVTYTAYDACGNFSSCDVYVQVVDERPPVIICERHTIVSLPITGEAHVPADIFDDGSYDDCGQVKLDVRRMDLSCQKSESDSTSITFGDYAVFCCEDVGGTHMVVLRATDHEGLSNQCMVEVTIDDKNRPSIVAPPDITVSCDFIFGDDLSVFGVIADSEFDRGPIVLEADSVNIAGTGFDGLSLGSCGVPITEDVDMGSVNSCGIGKVTRTFTATQNGVTVTDMQMITVVTPVEFDSTRIMWPRDTSLVNTCDLASLDPDNLPASYDRPTIDDGICELLGISITDERLFDPVAGGDACFKLFRTWSVIDWCDTDAAGLPARWDSTQVLGVENNQAPVILCDAEAEVYNSFDANCNPVMVSLSATATDECTPSDELFWSWSIDLNQDGTIDTTGNGNSVSASYVPGLHEITWFAEDLCGNLSLPCIQDFEITNDKAAPAICLDHVVTDLILMDLDFDGAVDAEMVEVWALDVIKADSHPCGHELHYSFDEAGIQDSIVYGCDDIGNNQIQVWVTDVVNGAQSFCWAEIEVQDNNAIDICGGTVHNPSSDGDISGFITTESGSQIADAEVSLLGSEIPNATTDISGMYAFNDMPLNGNYTVVPQKDINYINGVSTLDLVLIQKHILGLEILDSPYKILAADINRSNNVTAGDIVQLRKLILGEIDEYDSNTSWRFVDDEHEFASSINPWTSVIPEEFDITNLDTDLVVDFVGVKVGDVSGNAKGDELVTAEVRTSGEALSFNAEVLTDKDYQEVRFSSTNFREVNGYQMTIAFDAESYEYDGVDGEAIELTEVNVGLRYASRGMITLSWHSEEGLTTGPEDVIFKLYFKAKGSQNPISLESSSAITVQEAYVSGGIRDKVDIEMVEQDYASMMELKQNEPNPWRESTLIGFTLPEADEVSLRIFDNTGKLIKHIKERYSRGYNELTIGRETIAAPGIYLYEVQYRDQVEHKRMIMLY